MSKRRIISAFFVFMTILAFAAAEGKPPKRQPFFLKVELDDSYRDKEVEYTIADADRGDILEQGTFRYPFEYTNTFPDSVQHVTFFVDGREVQCFLDCCKKKPRHDKKKKEKKKESIWNDYRIFGDFHHLGAECLPFGIEAGPLLDFSSFNNTLMLGMNVISPQEKASHIIDLEFELRVWPFVLADPHITNIYLMATPFYYKRNGGENYFSFINLKSYLNIYNFIDSDHVHAFGPFASVNYTPYYRSNKYIASAGIYYYNLLFNIESGYRVADGRRGGYYVSAGFDVFLLLFGIMWMHY